MMYAHLINTCIIVFQSPGPGAYLIVNPNQYKNQQPAYSLTSRNITPGDTVIKPGPGAHQSEQVSR